MKRFVFFFLLAIPLLGQLNADDIHLGGFPQGKWLDSQWQAYWVFGADNIRLLDVHDQEIFNFAGIVQNLKIEKLASGIRLTFDCAKARRSYLFETATSDPGIKMVIRQQGNPIPYKMDMPTVSDKQLADYKQAIIAAKPAEVAKLVAAIENTQLNPTTARASEPLQKSSPLENQTAELLDQASKADFTVLTQSAVQVEKAGLLDQAIARFEVLAAKPDAPPTVFLALSVLYGRKGLKTQEYAAIEQAEKAPVPPGVNFSIALVYGRKQLLAGAPDADSFMVGSLNVTSNPGGALVNLDGTESGITPCLLQKISAGTHTVTLTLAGYENATQEIELGVGRMEDVPLTFNPAPIVVLLKNASFEEPSSKGGEMVQAVGWECGGKWYGHQLSNSEYGQEGNNWSWTSFKGGGSNNGFSQSFDTNYAAGRYELSVWINADGRGMVSRIILAFKDKNGELIELGRNDSTSPYGFTTSKSWKDSWQQQTLTIDLNPENPAIGRPIFVRFTNTSIPTKPAAGDSKKGDSINYDNVSLLFHPSR